MRKYLLSVCLMLFMVTYVSALSLSNLNYTALCYQETANASDSSDMNCALNYTGLYEGGTYNWINYNNLFDGDFSSFGTQNATFSLTANLYVNYSKPANASNQTGILSYRYGAYTIDASNVNIFPECLSSNLVQFKTTTTCSSTSCVYQPITTYCYNYTSLDWIWLTYGTGYYGNRFYEEGIFWGIHTPILSENNQTFNISTYESKTENFLINLSYDYTDYSIKANFTYNGTIYPGTLSTTSNPSEVIFSKSLLIPANMVGNNSLYWTIYLTNTTGSTFAYNSTFYNQTVNSTIFGLCNSTNNITYVNFTFLDETTGLSINASADLVTWNYGLSSDLSNTFLFTNTSTNPSYSFCFQPSDITLNNQIQYFQYSNTGYPQRQYYYSGTLTNTTTNKVLYLLGSSSGIYSTIQVLTTAYTPLPGVTVQIQRQFGGVWTLIGQGVTDAAGTATFWVNPNYDHMITASKTGYPSSTVTIRPTQSIYSLFLSGGTNATYVSTVEGVSFVYSPQAGVLNPGTRTFTYNVTSSKSNMVNCRFDLVYVNGTTLVSTVSPCITAGNLTTSVNVNPGDQIYGKYYVDVGTGYLLLDGDGDWKCINTTIVRHGGSIKELLSYLSDDTIWATNGDEYMRYEYSKIVLFFLIVAIFAAAANIYTSFDILNPGMFLLGLPIIFVILSAAGGLTGHGLLYLQGATKFSGLDNWIITIFSIIAGAGIYFGYIRRHS